MPKPEAETEDTKDKVKVAVRLPRDLTDHVRAECIRARRTFVEFTETALRAELERSRPQEPDMPEKLRAGRPMKPPKAK